LARFSACLEAVPSFPLAPAKSKETDRLTPRQTNREDQMKNVSRLWELKWWWLAPIVVMLFVLVVLFLAPTSRPPELFGL
jgi:hypothetical protein